jgi:dTDP-4-dehydrorhamnose reductase
MITGSGGQLGRELLRRRPGGFEVFPFDHATLDLTQADAITAAVDFVRPELIINTAAYTNVDGAESERELAFAVNALGAGRLAQSGARMGARMIQLSTDYVFNGRSPTPYVAGQQTNPINAYGASKLEGERLVADATTGAAVILRTAWVYAGHGKNFVITMLRLMRERTSIDVVYDQVGTPTWAGSLADTLWRIAGRTDMSGVHHWTDAGVASWYDFSVAIMEEALQLGIIPAAVTIKPVTSDAVRRPAARPAFSVLEKSATWARLGVPVRHWRESLRDMLQEYRDAA